MRFSLGDTARSGRTWDRSGREADRLGLAWADFEPLLQGLLVDAEGRPVSLSTTGFHSALGRIRDTLAASGALRELVHAVVRELGAGEPRGARRRPASRRV